MAKEVVSGRQLNRNRPERVYHELDKDRAKLLYTVLKLQDQDCGATQQRIAEVTKFDIPQVSRFLQQLTKAGYVIESKIHGEEARKVYEVDALNVTFRDSAVILLELLKYQEEGDDPEGKVEVEAFVKHLLSSRKLKYFNTAIDLTGDGKHPGKIDLLAQNGDHLERVTPRFIKPRLKAKLQKFYLELVATQIPLEDVEQYQFKSRSALERQLKNGAAAV